MTWTSFNVKVKGIWSHLTRHAKLSHMVAKPQSPFEQSMDEGRRKAAASIAALSRRSKLSQCLEMQEELRLAVLDPLFPREKKAAMVAAWDKLEDRIRILRDKPLPGSLSHEKVKTNVTARRIAALSTLASTVSADESASDDASDEARDAS
jgi:hypothetical protein